MLTDKEISLIKTMEQMLESRRARLILYKEDLKEEEIEEYEKVLKSIQAIEKAIELIQKELLR